MYSQNDEEFYILRESPNIGNFLDIGAYDGKTFSNTHELALRGWGGVCIEPSPLNFKNLSTLYSENSKVNCLEIAIGSIDGVLDFYDTPMDLYGSLSAGNGNKYGQSEIQIQVNCITPNTLFENKIGYNFDFISLDVEGNNFQVLCSIPFEKLQNLKLICVEHDSMIDEITNFLYQFNFLPIHQTGENLILKKILS